MFSDVVTSVISESTCGKPIALWIPISHTFFLILLVYSWQILRQRQSTLSSSLKMKWPVAKLRYGSRKAIIDNSKVWNPAYYHHLHKDHHLFSSYDSSMMLILMLPQEKFRTQIRIAEMEASNLKINKQWGIAIS